MKYSKILILGATGRCGQRLLKLALDLGYKVNVLVREKNKISFSHPDLKIIEGTPTDRQALARAMEGCQAILSTLNISRTSDFPWSNLKTPGYFLSDTANNIVLLSPKFAIDRVIVLSAWGVGNSRNDLPVWFQWLIDHSNIGVAYKDHLRQEEILRGSTLRFTAVRPVGLTNSETAKEVLVSINNNPKPAWTISRKNVARFMLNILQDDLFITQTPVIYT